LITPGQAHDAQGAAVLLSNLKRKSVVIADKGYDADWIRAHIRAQGPTFPTLPAARDGATAGKSSSTASAT
jgi:IS5 family transposase